MKAKYLLPVIALITCVSNVAQAQRDPRIFIEDDNERPLLLYDRSRALLIGQSQFSGGWNELDNVREDMKNLKETLEAQNFYVEVRENVPAGRIIPLIKEFSSANSPSTRALIYISGHGWTSHGATFLVGSDSKLPPLPLLPDSSAMVPVEYLRGIHKYSKAKHTLLILDTCFAGAVLKTKSATAPTRLRVEQIRLPVFQILASGQSNQRVAGDSTFANLFVDGVKGAASKDSLRKFLTFRQLANWLVDEVSDRTLQVPVYADVPDDAGDMVFLTAPPDAAPSQNRITRATQVEAEQQTITSQTGTFRARFPTTVVNYYRKSSDGLSVVGVLNKAGVEYVARPAELPEVMRTNALGCGPHTSMDAVKALANAMIEGGIPLARIGPFRNGENKGGRIEVLANANGVDAKTKQYTQNLVPLTRAEIDAVTVCKVYASTRQPG